MLLDLEKTILEIVNNSTGIKGVELGLKVIEAIQPAEFSSEQFNHVLEMMVHDGKIMELEYTVPQMDYRIKSIYFPKRTVFKGVK